MGQPKLLMSFGGRRLIDRVLEAWTSSRVDEVVVVVRSDDADLLAACRAWNAHVHQTDHDTADMKASVILGLQFLEQRFAPSDQDHCFVAPADLPTLSGEIIDQMVGAIGASGELSVPMFGDKQGHPVLMPWAMTQLIAELGPREGIDKIVSGHPKRLVAFDAQQRVRDVDTPAEYEALAKRWPRSD